MKKILLLGDSIRMGYASYIKDNLKNTCEVIYDEQDNGRFAAYTLWQANQLFMKYGHFDIVHWNNGYWDMNIEGPMTDAIHPIDEYIHFLKRIIKEIRRNGAKIIFATTTPVLSEGHAADNTGTNVDIRYNNKWVIDYNDAAKKLMDSENIAVNDLYSLMLNDKNYYKSDDLLHLTEKGSKICAKQASEMIKKML